MSWVVLRHQGCVWAVPGDQVRSIETAEGAFRLHLNEGCLLADEVLCVDEHLDVRDAGSVFSWATPPGCSGAAISRHGPAIIIDPNQPPVLLLDKCSETKNSEDQDEV